MLWGGSRLAVVMSYWTSTWNTLDWLELSIGREGGRTKEVSW
jgi:hypothetical protein